MAFVLLFLLGCIQGEESNGSIFQFINSEDIKNALSPATTIVPEPAYLNEKPSSTSTTTSTADSFFDQLIEISLENQRLNYENEELQQQYSALQKEITNVLYKINLYRLDDEIEVKSLSLKVESLGDLTRVIREGQIRRPTSEDDDLSLTAAMIFAIAVGFAFLLLQAARRAMGNALQSFLSPVFLTIFVNTALLLIILSLSSIAYYLDAFDDDYLEFEWILSAVALFTIAWMLLGLWFILAAQSFAITWLLNENACKDIRGLTQSFNDAQMDYEQDGGRLSAIKEKFKYAVMRQMFICPTVIPPVTETYLRSDFDLSEYLCRALAMTLERVLQLNWLSYMLIVLSMIGWRLLSLGGDLAQFIFFWAVPVVLIAMAFLHRRKMQRILNSLLPEVSDQVISNFPRNEYKRTPEMNADIFPKPPYLQGFFHPSTRETYYVNLYVWRGHPLKLTWGYMLAKKFPNRHDLLFWFDMYGVDVSIGFLQAFSVILTLWIALLILFYSPMMIEDWSWWGVLMIVGGILFWMYLAGVLLPENVRELTLVSKIEMKKDRKLIEEVVLNEKIDKAEMMTRMYRKFKTLYHDEFYRFNPAENTPPHLTQLITEMYELSTLGSDRMDIFDLQDFLDLNGIYLRSDELRLFAKESNPDENQEIEVEGIQTACAQIQENAALDSGKVTVQLIGEFLKKRGKKDLKHIGLDDLKEFLEEHGWHFSSEDIEDFMWETRWILEDISLGKVNELGGMVKTNTDMFPR